MGDLISSLAGVRHLYKTTGKKAIVYQQLNRAGEYFLNATHPTKGPNGEMVCFNGEMYDMMLPLMLMQDYIQDFEVYEGEEVDYDLDVVRQQIFCGAPHYPLQKWTWQAYPEMECDLSESWIQAETIDRFKDVIVCNFTERYRNHNINYYFLNKYQTKLVFTGTEDEHRIFCDKWNLTIPLIRVKNFLELAEIIKSCKFFFGNQSFNWHLAQAMHVPRILELFPYAQNCTNFGANGYEFYNQNGLVYHFEKLFNQ
jgi:hypothetical protein